MPFWGSGNQISKPCATKWLPGICNPKMNAATSEDLEDLKQEIIRELHIFAENVGVLLKGIAANLNSMGEKIDRFQQEIRSVLEKYATRNP